MKTIFNFIKKNRNIILLIISFVFLTMLILGMTYAYFDLKTGGETESTMNIGGAEISATYAYSNSINITDALLAEKRVSVLMGDVVEPRKDWINENVEFSLEDDYIIETKRN